MNLYVIGPVTGIEDENRQAFEHVKKQLEEVFDFVDIPHEWVTPGVSWKIAMGESIRRMMSMVCNAEYLGQDFGIAMLDGWNESRGAVIEYTLAQQLGIPCKPWREWL